MTLDIYAGLFDDDLDAVGERLSDAAGADRADSTRTKHLDGDNDDGLSGGLVPVSPAMMSCALRGTRTPNLLIRSLVDVID